MKTSLNQLRLGALSLILGIALSAPATADGRNPSSLLIFPQFRHGASAAGQLPSVNTVITVTNTHPALTAFVHFVVVDATLTGGQGPCGHYDRKEQIPACGSLSFLTNNFIPPATSAREGFIYAYAVQNLSAAAQAVSFNFLTGDLLVVDGVNAPSAGIVTNYSVSPVGFAAVNNTVNALLGFTPPTSPQLNGVVYSKAPSRILIPRFMGQDQGAGSVFTSELVLLSLAGTTTTTSPANSLQTIIDFLVFNDNEEAFSAQHLMTRCWERTSLLSINGIFAESFLRDFTTDNPNEIRKDAAGATKEAGWMYLEGNVAFSTSENISQPAIMAFLIEQTTSSAQVGAELPFFVGERNGRLAP